jgi:hypothetical protein
MTMNAAVALLLVQLSGPDGQAIFVNPEEVVSVREPRDTSKESFASGTKCVIQTIDGKIVNVADDCDTVRAKMRAREP